MMFLAPVKINEIIRTVIEYFKERIEYCWAVPLTDLWNSLLASRAAARALTNAVVKEDVAAQEEEETVTGGDWIMVGCVHSWWIRILQHFKKLGFVH